MIRATRAIRAGAKKFVQHIVFVGCKNYLANGQAHHARNMSGAYITEVAGRHRKRDLFIIGLRRGKVAFEIVNNLRRYARPIDRVDCTNLVLCLESVIVGHRLHQVLRIVEHAFNGNVENIVILQRIHLRALKARHLTMRREHEHADTAFSPHCIFRRRTRVAGGRAEDVQFVVLFTQRIFEQVAE